MRGNGAATSRLTRLRVPVTLQVADQRRTEVAIGLLARIDREVRAEHVEWLLSDADRPPVPGRATHAGIREPSSDALHGRIHGTDVNDLVANQPALRAVTFEPALVLNRLARDAIPGEARQPHVCGPRNDTFLARWQCQERVL